jgi:Flp pilus assembly protein TadG
MRAIIVPACLKEKQFRPLPAAAQALTLSAAICKWINSGRKSSKNDHNYMIAHEDFIKTCKARVPPVRATGQWGDRMQSNNGLIRVVRRFLPSCRGNIAIITALILPAIVGFCGLGAETGYWYFRQRVVQNAADVAAYDGDVVLRNGNSTAKVTATASAGAVKNGWQQASGTITVNTPPASGSHQTTSSVEVLLTESEPRYFSAIFSNTPLQLNVRAVASYQSAGPACMLGLDKSRSGTVDFWGNATADFTDCNVISNSLAPDSFMLGGAANVSTPCVSSAGGASVSATLTLTSCTDVTTHAAPALDPYANAPAPPIPGACSASGGATLSPGKFCGGLTLQGNVTLSPGVYVVSGGPLKINANANIQGTGVTFYLTNGATLQLNGNAHENLSAPTQADCMMYPNYFSGAGGDCNPGTSLVGLLFYGDRTQPYTTNTLNGDNSSTMTGAIYFPSQEVDFLGNFSGNNGCLQVVSDRIYYTGDGTFHTNCTGAGLAQINTPGAVTLVE